MRFSPLRFRLTTAPRRAALAALIAFTAAGSAPSAEPEAADKQQSAAGWAVGIGGHNRDYLTDIATAGGDGIYLAGHFLGTFEAAEAGALDSAGDADGFLMRLDGNGRALWARRFGAPGADETRAVAAGPQGEVYVAGFFTETVDFDPGAGRLELTSAGSSDVFLARLDRDGALVWARSFGGPFGDLGLDLAVGPSGAVHLAGYFQGEVDFDPGPGEHLLRSAGGTDAFFARFDANGGLLAAASFGGTGSDEARGVALGADGQARVCGVFRGRAGWSGGALESAGSSDAFIARLDGKGELAWLRRWGGESTDSCNAIAVSPGGELAATGRFAGTAGDSEAEAELVSAGSTDAWLLRLAPDGAPRWARRVGETGSDFGFGVAMAADRVWMAGFLQPIVGAGGPAETRSFLAAFDAEGELLSQRLMSATTGIQALAVVLDPLSRPIVAGVFDGDATLDPGAGPVKLPGAGKVDIFVARFPATD